MNTIKEEQRSGSHKHSAFRCLQEWFWRRSISWQFSASFDFSVHFILLLENQMFNHIITPSFHLSRSCSMSFRKATHHSGDSSYIRIDFQNLHQGDNCLWSKLFLKILLSAPEEQYADVIFYNKFNTVSFSFRIETDCCFSTWTPRKGLGLYLGALLHEIYVSSKRSMCSME